MSAKVHLHLHVTDLAKSRAFYEKFLGAGPVKVKPGYVKFLPEWAPVNLALSAGGQGGQPPVDPLGVQLAAAERGMAQLARGRPPGRSGREEMGVNCCHATKDRS